MTSKSCPNLAFSENTYLKMAKIKVVQKFCKSVDEFFYFNEISEMRILVPKNAFLQGAKKEVKKVIKSKNDFSKSCPKFCKLGDDFFFDEISKMRLLRRKNGILIMYIIYIINRAFLALEPPKIKIMTKNFIATYSIAQICDLTPFLG